MKAIIPLFILIFAPSVIAQAENIGVTKVLFFGEKSKKLYYSEACGGQSAIPASDFIVFTNKDPPPEKQGFTLSSQCPDGRKKSTVTPGSLVIDTRISRPKLDNPSLALIASDFNAYRSVLLQRNVFISIDTGSWGANGYGTRYSAFDISDGSKSEIVYAPRESSATKQLKAAISQSNGSIKVRVLHRPKRQNRILRMVFADLVEYTILDD